MRLSISILLSIAYQHCLAICHWTLSSVNYGFYWRIASKWVSTTSVPIDQSKMLSIVKKQIKTDWIRIYNLIANELHHSGSTDVNHVVFGLGAWSLQLSTQFSISIGTFNKPTWCRYHVPTYSQFIGHWNCCFL